MKKFLLLFILLLTSVFLISCSNTGEFETVKNENLILFYQGEDKDNVTRDLTLLLKSLEVENTTITWTSDNEDVIKVFGSKGQVFRKTEDAVVKLTATIDINGKKKSVDFMITVKAIEEAKVFTVSFDVDGGSTIDSIEVTENGVINAPTNPTKEGFMFVGWYKEAVFTNLWDFTNDKVSSNTTLYAKWVEEGVQIESKLFDLDFSNSNFGNSYSSNQGATKALPNLLGGELNVVLHRAAANNNHSVYTDDFLIISASNTSTDDDFGFIEFDFGREVTKIEFDAAYWSSFDAEQNTTLSLQVKNGDVWTSVFDIKADLNSSTTYKKVEISNLTEEVYRIYATGIDPTVGSNGSRVIIDNMKVYGYVEAGEDLVSPVINGAVDLTAELNETVDLLSGVTAVDDVDGTVEVKVLSSDVDNTKAGTYTVVYEAVDDAGNKTTATIKVTIKGEAVLGEALVAEFDFAGTDFGYSYSSNQGVTKNLPNIVGGSLSVVLHRAVANNNHTTYKDDFLLLSASNKNTTDDFAYIVFDFGKEVSRIEFDGAYWSSNDAEQIATLSLQVKDGTSWTDVFDIKASLDNTVEYKKISIDNLSNSEYRIYATGIDPTGTGDNGARVIFDNMKVFEVSDEDTIAPVINGAVDLTVEMGTTINLLDGITAVDNIDGSVSVKIYSTDVNTEVEGEYTVVYEAIDAAGNRNTVSIKVTVFEKFEADGKLAYEFDFLVTDFGTSYSTNNNTTKTMTNIVDGSSFSVTLTRVANNSNHAVYKDKFMLFSSATDQSDLNVSEAIFDFGQDISSMVFEAVYWSSYDVEQNTKFVLQEDVDGTWVDVFDIRAALAGTLEYKEIAIDNLVNSKYRMYLEGSKSLYSNGGRILLDNLKVYTGGGATPEEKNLNKDYDNLEIINTIMVSGPLDLPIVGPYGSSIEWSLKSPSTLVDLDDKQVTMPETGQVTVTFVATLKNGDFTLTKELDVVLGESASISISDVYGLSESSQFKTTGVVTNIFTDTEGLKFFIQDGTKGILVYAPASTSLSIKDKVEVIGSKANYNGQNVIDNVLKLTVIGTEEFTTQTVDSPLLYNLYLGKKISTSGVLINDYNNENIVVLLNEYASFDVVIPEGLTASIKTAISDKLTNKEVGLLVTISGNVFIDEENYSIMVTKASDIIVDTMINTTIIIDIVAADLVLPTGGNVNRDMVLPTSIGVFDAITIDWVSNKPLVISNTGKVTTSTEDVTVELSYTIKLGTNEIDSGTISFVVTASGTYEGYYSSLTGLSGTALKSELSRIVSNMKTLSYGDARYILDDSDADPSKSGNVILVYNRASVSGVWDGGTTWNREHVWPQSKLGTASDSDIHNLKPANNSINSSRSNLPFLSGSGTFGHVSGGWYPGEEDKGDIARIVFYMNIRWGLAITSTIGNLSTFIEWHNDDPVDDFEMNRNNILFNKQNNRNPFIDHPELVSDIYGQVVTNYDSYKPSAKIMLEYTLESVELYEINFSPSKKESFNA